jgi:2',3'-cyclic-nucleotide 2'-phosphodiesterase (5'-nucleotidase family)
MQSQKMFSVPLPFRYILGPALLSVVFSCNTLYQPVQLQHEGYRISGTQQKDSGLLQLIQPYSDSVNKSMNLVVGEVSETLEKRQPEGSLNNFMADAIRYAAGQHFNMPVDAAFVNYGGIRITQLPKGAVTRGKIFELMPFDNVLVVQQLTGQQLQEFLDLTAERGGWPMSGISMRIENKKAADVQVNGAALDPAKLYNIVNSDYVANGGDNANMLKNIPQKNTGYLMRDALFDYISFLNRQGQAITPATQKRILDVQ